jgi:hypothetical protein
VQRDFERDDRRRRYRPDDYRANDDPRDDPRERYGNEEDPYSREYRRAYAEQDLPRRMHNDQPYNRPGYEPEFGRPGQRENVDLERGDPYREYRERYAGDRSGAGQDRSRPWSGRRTSDDRGNQNWQGGYYGQGRRWSGQPFDDQSGRGYDGGSDHARDGDRGARTGRYDQNWSGFAPSPYDEGEVGSWYGGDTGMGDPGSSRYGTPPGGGWQPNRPYDQRQRFDQRGGYGAGRFSGHGPRGYQRSDDRIRDDVCELLTRHGDIDAREMDVEVRDATVFLRGTADSGRTRRLAEELVEEIPGVRDVQNELRVSRRAAAGSDVMVDSGTFASDRGGPRERHTPAYGTGVASTSGVSTRRGPGEPGAGAGAGPSQHGNPWQIRETMDVVGSDGEKVGTVKETHGTDFVLDRPPARSLFVPFSAVRTVDGERVLLSVRADQIDDQQWPSPTLTGSPLSGSPLSGSNESPAAR